MSNRVKHFIIGAFIIFGAGILFTPLLSNQMPFMFEPEALNPQLPSPAPFLAVSNEADKIDQAITQDRQNARVGFSSKDMPALAWTVRLNRIIPSEKIDAFVDELQAQGYFAYAREDDKKNRYIFVGPEIKQERAQQIAVQLRDKLKLAVEVVRYVP